MAQFFSNLIVFAVLQHTDVKYIGYGGATVAGATVKGLYYKVLKYQFKWSIVNIS